MTRNAQNPTTAAADGTVASAPPAQGAAPRVPVPSGTLRVTSEKLFAGALEVQIDHHGTLYRLKKTALGKLILTK